MTYPVLFFDLDHTLWDFDANARQTLEQLHIDLKLVDRGIHDFDQFYRNYLAHNDKLWARYRNGYIKQEELRLKRMWLTLLDFRIADEALARQLSELFLQLLPSRNVLFPDTIEVLTELKSRGHQMHIITNGFEEVQHQKMKNSGLMPFFGQVITSEKAQSLKPQKEIFEFALKLTGAKLEESIMIGDNLDVDVLGAMNCGMHQVHVNYAGAPGDLKPSFTVSKLTELTSIL